MEFLIISGMSGAGKSLAADILEDVDYYCVDNMPVALLPRFAELCLATRGRYERVALVTDVRERESISGLIEALDRLWEQGLEYRILYVEADMPTIVRRYKSSRRPHPMLAGGSSRRPCALKWRPSRRTGSGRTTSSTPRASQRRCSRRASRLCCRAGPARGALPSL